MKSEVRGVRFSPPSLKTGTKKQKRGISHVQEPVKLTHLKNTQQGTMRAMRSLHTEPSTDKSEVKLGNSRVSSRFLTNSQEEKLVKPGLVRENQVEIESISRKFV